MKTLSLIQTLRRQAVDDELGVICCHPPEQVRTYFQMALDLAALPPPALALLIQVEELLVLPAAPPAYAAWSRLFDFILEWATSGRAVRTCRTVLQEAGTLAVRTGAAAKLERVLALHAECLRLWPEAGADFLPRLTSALRTAPALTAESRAACRMALLGAWEKEGVPPPWGTVVLQALRRGLTTEAATAEAAAELMEHLREPAQLAGIWSATWRRTLADSKGRPELIEPILEESRRVLPLLPGGPGYELLYQAAVQAVAQSEQDCGPVLRQILVAGHPAADGLAPLLALREPMATAGAAWETPAWRTFACALCRESDPARRAAWAQGQLLQILSGQLHARPATWFDLIGALGQVMPAGFPDRALRERWLAQAATFPDLSAAHLRALEKIAGPAAAAAAGPWCALGEALGDRLRPADRRAWFGIALELLVSALRWDPAALAETTARWRGFVQALLLAQTGYAGEANRILACQRETLDGPLYEACAALRPQRTAVELDTLKSCGVGLGRP